MRRSKRARLKRPLLAFLSVIGVLIAGALWFIQSSGFAGIVKKVVAENLPDDLGIDGDFSEFTVKMFPPGLSVNRPRITVRKLNFANLPEGSRISAERIDLNFYPLQMLSGSIRVHEAVIVNGDVRLVLDPAALGNASPKRRPKKSRWGINWDELFQVRAEAVAFENTRVFLEWTRPKIEAEFTARALRLAQWTGRGGLGYELDVELESVKASFPSSWRLPRSIDRIRARVHLNALGVQIEEVALWSPGVNLSLAGEIKGNLLDPKSLETVGALKMDGELDRILMLAAVNEDARGQVAFDGRINGDLLRLGRTLELKGSISGRDIRFRRWEADELSAEGAWKAGSEPGFGEIVLDKARVAAISEDRRGGFRPGRGGVVNVGAFSIRSGSAEPVTVPVELEGAHLHWLAAPVLEETYPMDFRASGKAEFVFTPPAEGRPWTMGASLDLAIPRFQLDNQRWRKRKPLTKIVVASDLRLNGAIDIDSRGFSVRALDLLSPKSRFKVEGKVKRPQRAAVASNEVAAAPKGPLETVFGLKITGTVDLSDVEGLAENEIRGKGGLITTVHGPTSNVAVDFDADLQDVYYLNLHLGNVKGRVTWADAVSKVLFKRMVARKASTEYIGEGELDIDRETVALGFEIPKGDVQDLVGIFREIVSDIWWFPESMTGKTRGRVDVTGGLNLKALSVMGSLNGEDWDFAGEKFRQVTLSGGFDRGRYVVQPFNAVKGKGLIGGRIAWDEKTGLDWDIATRGLEVSDLNLIARLEVPFRGAITLKSSGKGLLGDVQSVSEARISDFVVRGISLPSSELKVRLAGGKAYLNGTALGGQGRIDSVYDFKKGAESYAKIDLMGLDYTPVLLLLNSKLIRDRKLQGLVSGALDLKFRTGEIELANGTMSVNNYVLAKNGARFELVQPMSVEVKDGTFDIRGLAVKGNRGEARLDLTSRKSDLDGSVAGEIDVNIAEFITSEISSATGLAALDFKIGGKIKEPKISGRAVIRESELRMDVVESPLENVRGVFQLEQNVVTIKGLRADLSGGKAEAKGTVVLYAHRYPELDVGIELMDSQLKIYPFQQVKAAGMLTVKGDRPPYPVAGDIVAKSAMIREKVLSQGKTTLRKSARYTPPPGTLQEADFPLFKLNIHAKADRNIFVQNDLFDAELKGDVTLLNTIKAPRLTGVAEMIQGKMRFKDREFGIESGRVNFDNPTVINPRFDLTAVTDVNNIKIRMYASGRLDSWKVELSSAPVLPEGEILNLLALGFTSEDLQRLRAGDREVLQRGEAASLLLHSLDFNREIQDKTGLQIRLDEAVDTQTGASSIRPATEADSSVAPKIVIKRKIGKKVEISAGSTVPGVGTGSQQELNAEVEVLPGVSVRGAVNSVQGTQTSDSQTPDTQTSIGIDLKFQKRFK